MTDEKKVIQVDFTPAADEVDILPCLDPTEAPLVDPESEREYDEAKGLLKVTLDIENGPYKLTVEFLMFFLRAIRNGDSTDEAIVYALSEWDL